MFDISIEVYIYSSTFPMHSFLSEANFFRIFFTHFQLTSANFFHICRYGSFINASPKKPVY